MRSKGSESLGFDPCSLWIGWTRITRCRRTRRSWWGSQETHPVRPPGTSTSGPPDPRSSNWRTRGSMASLSGDRQGLEPRCSSIWPPVALWVEAEAGFATRSRLRAPRWCGLLATGACCGALASVLGGCARVPGGGRGLSVRRARDRAGSLRADSDLGDLGRDARARHPGTRSDPEQSAMNGSPASLGPKVRRCAAAGVENSDPVAYSTGDEEFVGSDLRLELVSRPAVGSRHCAGPPRRSPPA
jgi:hypothetical protein